MQVNLVEAERSREEEGVRARECDAVKRRLADEEERGKAMAKICERERAEGEEKARIRERALTFALDSQREAVAGMVHSPHNLYHMRSPHNISSTAFF